MSFLPAPPDQLQRLPRLSRWLYRGYRKAKVWFLVERPPVLTAMFFSALAVVERWLSPRTTSASGGSVDNAWHHAYIARYSHHPRRRYRLRTRFPVAVESDDHRHPRGTILDNSVNPRFNRKLYQVLGRDTGVTLLDLGCAGGGLVHSVLKDGNEAVGLEGSDLSLRERSGDWSAIPFHLFTCNIVRPFRLLHGAGRPARFDVVTAWEVLEHIPERDLDGLIRNIKLHLKAGGLFICSIDLLPDGNPLKDAVYHKTVRSARWWREKFREEGMVETTGHPFRPEDMVRGHGLDLKNWHPADGSGIHLVLRRAR